MSNSEQSLPPLSHHNSCSHRFHRRVSLRLRIIDAMENAMYFDLTNLENTIAASAIVLIVIFALAAFLDSRCRKAEPLRRFGFDHGPQYPSESPEGAIGLYAPYADLSACGLGTPGQQIRFRTQISQNLEGTRAVLPVERTSAVQL